MPEALHHGLEYLVYSISFVAALVLAWGVLVGLLAFVNVERRRMGGLDCDVQRIRMRKQVGFYLLFALELLVAADVVETMLEPSLEHVAVLSVVALLRIVIGFALGREVGELEERLKGEPAADA